MSPSPMAAVSRPLPITALSRWEDDIVPELSDGDWAGAARTYIEMADYTLDYYAERRAH